MKFGGTSVGDVAAFERVAGIVSSQTERRPVVVVSAMTKFTDALLNAFDIARRGDHKDAINTLETHFARHIAVTDHFIAKDDQETFLTELAYAKEELADLLPGCDGLNVLDSIYGHDGFLVESEAVGELIRQTLRLAAP